MSRSVKKGPYAEGRLMARIEAMNAAGEKNLVARDNDIPPDGRTHYSGLRRKKARSRIYNRRYGRLQARRVCPHQNVQGARG